MLSKAEEIGILAGFVRQLPDGYLRDIFAELAPEIEGAIRNDLGFVSLGDRRREQEERAERLKVAQAARAEAEKTRQALARECLELERRREQVRQDLQELRAQALRLARV